MLWDEKNLGLKMKNKNLIENGVCDITGSMLTTNDVKDLKDTTNEKVSGIYKIINRVNGKYYIGSSKNINIRYKKHISDLKRGNHDNDHLQKSYNKYGRNVFNLIIVEQVNSIDKLLFTEQKYLDIAKLEKDNTYNMSFTAGKIDMTPEICNKISKYFRDKYRDKTKHPWFGKHHSKENLQKISIANSGKNNGNFGKILSYDIRKKISYSTSGAKHWNFGKHWSEEIKNKMSKNHDNKYSKNPRFDNHVYKFLNTITNEKFQGNRYNFYTKYNLNKGGICNLIKNKIKCVKGWKVDI